MNPWPVAGVLMLIVALEMHLIGQGSACAATGAYGIACLIYGTRRN